MIKDTIAISKTVSSAVEQGAIALGVTAQEVKYEILEEPKKGFLGIGSKMAKVRVFITVPDTQKKAEKPARNADAKPQKKSAPKAEKKESPKPRAQESAEVEVAEVRKGEAVAKEVADAHPSVALLQTLLANLEIEASVTLYEAAEGEDQQYIDVQGEAASILIGHHGDTMDAVQYLANLASNRAAKEEFPKVKVDIEGYRARREAALRKLALRTAGKAKKFCRNFTLEPMNPYERRIIHSQLQGIEGISTHSIGSGNARRVVVTYEGN